MNMAQNLLPERILHPLCLFSAALSVITQPTGIGNLQSNVQRNLLRVSPPIAGLLVLSSVLRFISWRILNITDSKFCLAQFAPRHFDLMLEKENLDRAVYSSSTLHIVSRYTFFGAVTLPLYLLLISSTGYLWTKLWVTCLITQFILHEIFLSMSVYTKDKLMSSQRDWPANTLVTLLPNKGLQIPAASFSPSQLNVEPAAPSNACEAIKHFISKIPPSPGEKHEVTEENLFSPDAAFILAWRDVIHNEGFVWTCGHWRCLTYKILCIPLHTRKFWYLTSISLLLWILHLVLRPFTISLCIFFSNIRVEGNGYGYREIVEQFPKAIAFKAALQLLKFIFWRFILEIPSIILCTIVATILHKKVISIASTMWPSRALSPRYLAFLSMPFIRLLPHHAIFLYAFHHALKYKLSAYLYVPATVVAWLLESILVVIWIYSAIFIAQSLIAKPALLESSEKGEDCENKPKGEFTGAGHHKIAVTYGSYLVAATPATLLWYTFYFSNEI